MTVSAGSDFKSLFEKQVKGLKLQENEVVKGTVIGIYRDSVLVDVGFKSEGLVPLEEFRNFDGQISVNPGDVVDVMVEQLEDGNGNIILSKEKADAMHSWDRVQQFYESGASIEGVIVNKIKGGMSVNLGGIKAFLPASQIDLKPVKSLDKLIAQKCRFKILKLNQAKGNIVLSRRTVLEEERESLKKELLSNLREGQVVAGTVKNITDYGAFVDLGGIDGLLHITDISWGRVNHPGEALNVGDELEIVVLKYEKDAEKVSLGLKQLQPDPWLEVAKKFTPGERVNGKVVNVTDYGVFVEIAEGIEGLVHVSELTWSKKVKHPSKIVKVGDTVEAVILDVDPQNRRISLGIKQLETNPWDNLEAKFPLGSKVKGVVRNITDFGVFIGIEGEEIDGLVHISDLTWDKNIKHPSEVIQKGQEVEAVVLSIDRENERFALGLKQLTDDPWDATRRKYSVGSSIEGTVTEVQPKGVTVKLDDDLVGFIANSDLTSNRNDAQQLKVGDTVTAQVKKLDEKGLKVQLSIKAFEKSQERENMKDFLSKQGDATVKLGDALKPKE